VTADEVSDEALVNVPYFDLKTQYSGIREEILEALDGVCRTASFSSGPEVAEFEREFAAYCEVKHCVAVNSGTSALHLALLAAGVQAGDEVITTPNTFIATAEAISYAGARPTFVDVDPVTANIDAQQIECAITGRTKAIIPVHLYGRPADIGSILKIANRYGIPVIEDACQAHGARWMNRRVGGLGFAGAFSFYPGKNLGAYGEGGALTTNDDGVAERVRILRDHGQSRRYHHDVTGYNYRMDGFQGAVLRVKLRYLDKWNARRREIAQRYRESLATARVILPEDSPDSESVYHLFVACVENRDAAREAMEARGVQTAIHYPVPIHLQKAYEWLGHTRGSFPHTELAADRVLSLPLFPEMTDEQVEYAATALAEVVGSTVCLSPSAPRFVTK
jgi:dTDP-4-amino-4,6-dideoxygalactose transaminase